MDDELSQPCQIKYFEYLSLNLKNTVMPESAEKILVKFSLKNVQSETLYQISVKSLDNSFQNFSTETLETSNFNSPLHFSKYLIFSYFFEQDQFIEITITVKSNSVNDNKIYNFQRNTKISSLVCEKNCVYQRKIDENPRSLHKEILVLSAEKANSSIQYINILLKCKKENNINYSDNKNKIRYLIKNKENRIYLSEIVNNDGSFNNIIIPVELLLPKFSVLFYTYDKNLVNAKTLNVEEFTDKQKNIENEFIEIPLFNSSLNNNIIKIMNYSKLKTRRSLFEYVKSGIRLNIYMAIDISNKNNLGQIKKVIRSCGSILSYYTCTETKEPIFKVYCFGAKFKNSNSSFFNLNLQETPDIIFLKTVIKKYIEFYDKNQAKIELSDHINFSPLIKHISNETKNKNNPKEYNIFFIIANNNPTDIKDLIDTLIECSYLPLSIVIIGVGENLELLNNLITSIPTISSIGIEKKRNITQFISFNKIGFDEKKLSIIFLKEIAKQIVEYYDENNCTPDKMKQNDNDMEDIKDSTNKYKSFMDLKKSSIMFGESGNNNLDNEINAKQSLKNFTLGPFSENGENEEDKKKYSNTPSGVKFSVRVSSNPYCNKDGFINNLRNQNEDNKK